MCSASSVNHKIRTKQTSLKNFSVPIVLALWGQESGQKHMDMQWLNQARCLNEDPELFFPVGNTGPAVDQIEQAKAVCRECNVTSQCLEYAIKENQDTGVWGGLSEDERKSLKRKYARARRAS
jgi:WhiB family transcriptional regulator, redox-sensing transcriptional regulator